MPSDYFEFTFFSLGIALLLDHRFGNKKNCNTSTDKGSIRKCTKPILLGGTLNRHLENCQEDYPETVEKLKNNAYVDDVISGGETVEKVQKLNEESQLLSQEGFPLHKSHSSDPQFVEQHSTDADQTYAKEERDTKPTETKILGMKLYKAKDTIVVDFRECKQANDS